MWISLSILMVVLGICDSFHLQNQPRIRRSVCRRAPPCCPGHVCRAYQRFDASRPVAVCARSLESRPLYAPGSPAQQRICRAGSRSLPSTSQSSSRGLPQFRGSRQSSVRPGIGREGNRFGPSSRLQWDQMRTQIPQRFPGQPLQVSGQDVLGQSQMGGFPEFPPMPSFGSQSPRSDSLPSGLSPEQGLGQTSSFSSISGQQGLGQTPSFSSIPGQQGFSQGQRSFGRIDEQRFDVSGSGRGQGQQGILGQFPSGQRGQLAETGFEQGQPLSSFSGQSFLQSGGSGSLRGQSFGREQSFSGGSPTTGGLSFGSGQTFSSGSPVGGGMSFGSGQTFSGGSPVGGGLSFGSEQSFSGGSPVGGGLSFGSGQSFSGGSPSRGGGRSFSRGQAFGRGQSFGGAAFGQLSSGGGRGSAPQPFLVEQPPITATSISGSQDQSQTGSSQSQQP